MEFCSKLSDIYKGFSIIILGPGKSLQNFDVNNLFSLFDYTASLNDMVLSHRTDFYFVGEKFIAEYVYDNSGDDFKSDTKKIFMCIDRKYHRTRITKEYFAQSKQPNSYYIQSRNFKCKKKYNLSLFDKFSDRNMNILSGLLHETSADASYYIRARTLANAIQVLYGLGFSKVCLVGFMDSVTYERSDYKHQEAYLEGQPGRRPQDIKRSDLMSSFKYQSQILKTLSHVFKSDGRAIYDLNPEVLENGLDHIGVDNV